MGAAPLELAILFNEQLIDETWIQVVGYDVNMVLQALMIRLGPCDHIRVIRFRQESMLTVKAWIWDIVLQQPGRIAQLLLQSLQDRIVEQSAHFKIVAPCLVGQLHLELKLLVKLHELCTTLQALICAFMENVQQAKDNVRVFDLQVQRWRVLPVDADALPGEEGLFQTVFNIFIILLALGKRIQVFLIFQP